ncbi:MAG: hypothetical protein MJZ26_09860 [Fibrobacter sp.]|nr:hypothetical protein [Fibrobacter sp.]
MLDDEFTDELDLAELLLDPSTPALPPLRMTLDEEPRMTTEEEEDLSRFSVVAEDDIREELLDSRSGSGMTEEDDSSSSTAELSVLFSPDALVELESSPQALKANSAKATALVIVIFLKMFILKLC